MWNRPGFQCGTWGVVVDLLPLHQHALEEGALPGMTLETRSLQNGPMP